MHLWVSGIEVCSKEELFNSYKEPNIVFFLNQRYNVIICVYRFELFFQVNDVANGHFVCNTLSIGINSSSSLTVQSFGILRVSLYILSALDINQKD